MISAKELAAQLGRTPARVSQWVSEGKLEGCYTGEGRARRFDLGKCRAALLVGLDVGQMMGNGADTKRTLVGLQIAPTAPAPVAADDVPAAKPRQRDGRLAGDDPDRYTLARTQVAEEEARTKRRQNMQAEGKFVLTTEVERVVAQRIAQEVAEFESVLRRVSRLLADLHGLDFKAVRQVAVEEWRRHRGDRATTLDAVAGEAGLSDAERGADF